MLRNQVKMEKEKRDYVSKGQMGATNRFLLLDQMYTKDFSHFEFARLNGLLPTCRS